MPENAGTEQAVEEATNIDAELAHSITLEQQLQRIRAAAAEEEARVNFLARVDAHARATHALRLAKVNVTETVTVNQRDSSKRKKRRAAPSPKRRAHSASKVLSA
jgi:hypothetical protein